MKNFKATIVAALIALTGMNAQGMENADEQASSWLMASTQHATHGVKKPYTTCSLGTILETTDTIFREYKRDILVDGIAVGEIRYSETRDHRGFERFIESFAIQPTHQHLRGQGIGTICMEQFLRDARKDKVTFVSLSAVPKAANLYAKFGFEKKMRNSNYMEKQI